MKISEMTQEFAAALEKAGDFTHDQLSVLFNTHPTVEVFFITSDGQAFFAENMADSHGQKLKPRDVLEISRDEVFAATEQLADNEEATEQLNAAKLEADRVFAEKAAADQAAADKIAADKVAADKAAADKAAADQAAADKIAADKVAADKAAADKAAADKVAADKAAADKAATDQAAADKAANATNGGAK